MLFQFAGIVLAECIIAGITQMFAHFPAGLLFLYPVLMRLPAAGLSTPALLFRLLRQPLEQPAFATAQPVPARRWWPVAGDASKDCALPGWRRVAEMRLAMRVGPLVNGLRRCRALHGKYGKGRRGDEWHSSGHVASLYVRLARQGS